ncbi:hypothetical protein D3C71_1946420 [compost metagenome]
MFRVIGGVHKDFTFKEVRKGQEENYGPFATQQEALDQWKAKMWLNVDNALHRLRIVTA